MAQSTIFKTRLNTIGEKSGLITIGSSMTKQAFKDECDINRIMARYEATGQIEHLSKKTPLFGDFSNFENYQDLCNRANEVNEAFQALPSELRKELNYRPEAFVPWLSDPANRDKAVKYGLMRPQAVEKPRVVGDVKETPNNEN